MGEKVVSEPICSKTNACLPAGAEEAPDQHNDSPQKPVSDEESEAEKNDAENNNDDEKNKDAKKNNDEKNTDEKNDNQNNDQALAKEPSVRPFDIFMISIYDRNGNLLIRFSKISHVSVYLKNEIHMTGEHVCGKFAPGTLFLPEHVHLHCKQKCKSVKLAKVIPHKDLENPDFGLLKEFWATRELCLPIKDGLYAFRTIIDEMNPYNVRMPTQNLRVVRDGENAKNINLDKQIVEQLNRFPNVTDLEMPLNMIHLVPETAALAQTKVRHERNMRAIYTWKLAGGFEAFGRVRYSFVTSCGITFSPYIDKPGMCCYCKQALKGKAEALHSAYEADQRYLEGLVLDPRVTGALEEKNAWIPHAWIACARHSCEREGYETEYSVFFPRAKALEKKEGKKPAEEKVGRNDSVLKKTSVEKAQALPRPPSTGLRSTPSDGSGSIRSGTVDNAAAVLPPLIIMHCHYPRTCCIPCYICCCEGRTCRREQSSVPTSSGQPGDLVRRDRGEVTPRPAAEPSRVEGRRSVLPDLANPTTRPRLNVPAPEYHPTSAPAINGAGRRGPAAEDRKVEDERNAAANAQSSDRFLRTLRDMAAGTSNAFPTEESSKDEDDQTDEKQADKDFKDGR